MWYNVAMNEESTLIVLPLPSKYLHPNRQPRSRKGFIIKGRLTKERRALAREMMVAERIETAPWEDVEVRIKYFFTCRRRRDKDNLLAWLKATMDGLADGGIVKDDSRFTYMPVEEEIDKLDPRVEILLVRKG